MSKPVRLTAAEFTRLCRQERDRLSALRLQLIESHPFWGYLLLQMQLVFQADLPALAATDCMRHIWFNPALTSRLPIRQLGFVMVHEICHSVFATMERRGSRTRISGTAPPITPSIALSAKSGGRALSVPGRFMRFRKSTSMGANRRFFSTRNMTA
ncbi:MAG TPA: hypothetical protein PLM07_18325 [Candidatus Rifleibacterium sp.]|nr:hypothetical protein [Candidatus Rifleibacterium sp.]